MHFSENYDLGSREMKVSSEVVANAPYRGHMEIDKSSLSGHLCQGTYFLKNMFVIYPGITIQECSTL
jgi:hypothetical protein